ncbi:MAG: archease [Candidatus Poseidoniaceae archaeon]|nr:archease [Candidatus Poseidoniaceae archaeon]
MSYWPRPTTADIGLRAFSNSQNNLMMEAALGMQSILMNEESNRKLNNHIRHNSQWNVSIDSDESEMCYDLLLINWLDEVLYRCEIHQQWLVDGQIIIEYCEGKLNLKAQVSWIDSKLVTREIEIKAVTSHKLIFEKVSTGQEISSEWLEVPSFQGPGWYCDVIFDI